MTPWGVITIRTSWEAHMPGAWWAGGRPHRGHGGPKEGCRGLKRQGGGARSGSVSQLGEVRPKEGEHGSHLLHPSPSCQQPWVAVSPNYTPDLPTSLHLMAPPWARLPWSLIWTTMCFPHWIFAATLAPYTLLHA